MRNDCLKHKVIIDITTKVTENETKMYEFIKIHELPKII